MFSIVIPAFNEEKLIAKCLQSLISQTTKKKFEVIIVDNNSTDKTAIIVRKFKKKLNIRIINCRKQGRGIARAVGFAKSKGEIIFSTDADTTLPPNWLDDMLKQLTGEYISVTGPNKISDCSFLINFLYNNFQPAFYFSYNLIFKNSTLNGFNFCLKKSAYLKSEGFSESLNAQEDLDLGFKLAKIGKIKFCNNLYVCSSGRRFKNGLLKGLFEPIKTFIEYKFGKTPHLTNIRN